MTANNIIEIYINQVKQNIYNLENANNFINDIRNNLTEYIENNPDCSFDNLVEQFGNPEDVAKEFLDNTLYIAPQKILGKNKRHKTIIFILLAIVIAFGIYCIDMAIASFGHGETVTTIYDTVPTDENN